MRWRSVLVSPRGRVRLRGVRTVKSTLAAVAAYLVAVPLSDNPRPLLAPLTALLVVQLTLYDTVRRGMLRVVAVSLGVLFAAALSTLVPLTWWSLGAVVYEMVTGHVPFAGETPNETISLILQREPPPLTRYTQGGPAELERIITKALTRDREERQSLAHNNVSYRSEEDS